MLRVGIVGLGGISRAHGDAIETLPDVEIVAAADLPEAPPRRLLRPLRDPPRLPQPHRAAQRRRSRSRRRHASQRNPAHRPDHRPGHCPETWLDLRCVRRQTDGWIAGHNQERVRGRTLNCGCCAALGDGSGGHEGPCDPTLARSRCGPALGSKPIAPPPRRSAGGRGPGELRRR